VTHADRVLVIIIAVLALLSGPATLAASGFSSASSVIIEGPSGETVVPIGADRTLAVVGLRGQVVVEISDGAASVVSADCPDQVCVHAGPISRPGSAIVCVPNAVTVRIGGVRSDGLDVVSH